MAGLDLGFRLFLKIRGEFVQKIKNAQRKMVVTLIIFDEILTRADLAYIRSFSCS